MPEEYRRFTAAAMEAGVIEIILPYETEHNIWSNLMGIAKEAEIGGIGVLRKWYQHIYDQSVSINDVPYDTQFCKLLRAGLDEAYVALLMALLPNIRELDLYGTPYHSCSLKWRAAHGFRSLKTFIASAEHYEQGNSGFFKLLIRSRETLESEFRDHFLWCSTARCKHHASKMNGTSTVLETN
jgi:hypothetical protein